MPALSGSVRAAGAGFYRVGHIRDVLDARLRLLRAAVGLLSGFEHLLTADAGDAWARSLWEGGTARSQRCPTETQTPHREIGP